MARVHSDRIKPASQKPRARRKAEDEWTKHQQLLIRLFQEYPLVDVMTYMKAKNGFVATSRQYGYRFEKWNVKKYRTGQKRTSSRRVVEEMDNYASKLEDSDSSISQTPSLSPANSFSAASECIELLGNADDFAGRDGSITHHFTPQQERDKALADFCSAINDNDVAFRLYHDLYNSTLNNFETSSMAKDVLLISCVRTANNGDNARTAKGILLDRLSQGSDFETGFVFSMIRLLISERSGDLDATQTEDQIYHLIASIVDMAGNESERIDQAAIPRILNGCYDYDTIGYQYLSYGMKVYEKARIKNGYTSYAHYHTFSPEQIVNQYNSPTHREAVENCITMLRSCIEWCLAQLDSDIDLPTEVISFGLGDRYRTWTEDIQLFCTLWSSMHQDINDDQHELRWYRHCEATLGINPSDLLFTICRMIADTMRRNCPYNDLLLLQRAARGVELLLQDPNNGSLWMHFLDQFTQTKCLERCPMQGDEDPLKLLRDQCRSFASSTLGVELHTPTPETSHELAYEPLLEPAPEVVPDFDFIYALGNDNELFDGQLQLSNDWGQQ